MQKGLWAMDESQTQVVSDLLHLVLSGLRIDRLGVWSKRLEGITPLELHILKLAAERADTILIEVRKELGIPHSTLTSAIDRLERRGLLRRAISHRDRRSYALELTREGRRVQAEHDRIDHLLAGKILEALDTEKERRQLIRLLSKISERLTT